MSDALRILFHDDFDGAASAALLTVQLRLDELEARFSYAPVDYGMRLDWEGWPAQAAGFDRFAVVDFQYHRRASYFYDHHRSAFPTPEDRLDYDLRDEPHCQFDPAMPSCAHLIWSHSLRLPHLKPVVDAADLIDQAAYPSIEAYFHASRPEIGISLAWYDLTEGEKITVIERLAKAQLEQAALDLKDKIGAAVARNLEHLDKVSDHIQVHGDVAVMDCVSARLPFVRFAPYFYFPEAKYCLALYASGQDVRVGLGKNPWLEFPHRNLGALAAASGLAPNGTANGGGHPYAAGTIFRASQLAFPHATAWSWVYGAARWLNGPEGVPVPLAA